MPDGRIMNRSGDIRVVDWQGKRGILSQEERSVYRYAYELFLNQTINVGIAVLISLYLCERGKCSPGISIALFGIRVLHHEVCACSGSE